MVIWCSIPFLISPRLRLFCITMAGKKKSECTPTYCHIMKGKPWRAASFDWKFGGRSGIFLERKSLIEMVKKLNFSVFKEKSLIETRDLSKTNFIKELQRFKELCVSEPCGCILLTVSSHGNLVRADDKTFEDHIFTSKKDSVPVKEIFEVFRDEQLKQIPKIFFIQACRGEILDEGFSLSGNGREEQAGQALYHDDNDREHSTPYLENSVMIFSTPFGYSATSSTRTGSRVWEVLRETLKIILQPVQVNGPVNLLSWLKETNRRLAKSDEFKTYDNKRNEDTPYKPLLSICHTLTRQIILMKTDEKIE